MADINEDIRQRLLDQLRWDSRVDTHDLEVDLMDGRLTLRGSVPSYESMRLIEENAYAVAGLNGVDNAMAIRYPEDITVPTDDDIRSTIESGIRYNNSLNAAAIEIDVKEGAVTLRGAVDAYWKKRLAEDISASTIGVVRIDNQITVAGREEVMDEAIKEDVEKALERNYSVKKEWVNVSVDRGVATLTGSVPDFNAARAAYVAALYTNGVTEVHNDVKIKSI